MHNNLREAKNYIKELFDSYENEIDIYRAIMYLDNIEDLHKQNPNYAAYYVDCLKNYLKEGLPIAHLYKKLYIPIDEKNYKNEMKQIENKVALVKIILTNCDFNKDKQYTLNFCEEEIDDNFRYYFALQKIEKEKTSILEPIKEFGSIIRTVFDRYKQRKNFERN